MCLTVSAIKLGKKTSALIIFTHNLTCMRLVSGLLAGALNVWVTPKKEWCEKKLSSDQVWHWKYPHGWWVSVCQMLWVPTFSWAQLKTQTLILKSGPTWISSYSGRNKSRSPCDPVKGSRDQDANLSASLLSGRVRAIEAQGTDPSGHKQTLTFCCPVWLLWFRKPPNIANKYCNCKPWRC